MKQLIIVVSRYSLYICMDNVFPNKETIEKETKVKVKNERIVETWYTMVTVSNYIVHCSIY